MASAEKCPLCGRSDPILPSEDWPPYRWLWSRTTGRPWTHSMRDHPRLFLPIFLGFSAVAMAYCGRRYWPVPLAFGAGLLTGHVYW